SAPFRTVFASLSLHMTDRLRFLQFPQEIITAVQNIITNVWSRGIQDTRLYHGSYEIKLRGNPCKRSGYSDDAVHSRRLMNHILATLYQHGWILSLSTDISKKAMDKDTLIFRKQDPPPRPAEWFSISFSKTDRIRFIDAPQQLVSNMIALFQKETQSHASFRLPHVYELKMNGYPWMASGSDTMYARSLILKLIEGLESHGFTVYASIDQKTGTSSDNHRGETDTFHCCRQIGWQPGLPVFH
ncbi:hypothetical protein P152DRAFT_384025, partial [Eremomyces bilateralis CBS 781.70]